MKDEKYEFVDIVPCTWIGGIAWCSQEQLAQTLSMTKAEYMELTKEQTQHE